MAFPQQKQQRSQRRSDPRLKKCPFCGPSKGSVQAGGAKYIDYKDYPTIKPFVDYFGNIMNRYYTGVCLKHQKMLRTAVERARFLGFLAYRK